MAVRIALVAVGGKGTRLGRSDVQKCLIPIDEKPVVEHVVDALVSSGIKLIILLTGHLHEQVSAYLASRSTEGENFVLASAYGGTEGETKAIGRLRPFLQEDFLYTVGDCVFPIETVRDLIVEGEKRTESIAVMCVSPQRAVAPTHSRIVVGRTGYIRKVVPASAKSTARFITMGMYYFRPAALEFLSRVRLHGPVSEFVTYAHEAGERVSVALTHGRWFCLHTEEDLRRWSTSPMKHFLDRPKR